MGAEQLTGGSGPLQFCGQLYDHSYAERNRIYRTLDEAIMKDNFKTLDDLKKENEELQSKL